MNSTPVIIIINYVCLVTGFMHEQPDQLQLNRYLQLITNRTIAASKYEFSVDAKTHEAKDNIPKEYGSFDFIIIGAGSTGCVIANRLSEIADWKILLIEAGTYRDEEITGIPALWPHDGFTKFNWGFESTRQNYACLGNVDNKCKIPRGKGIGGSSLINGLLYTRGNEFDYNKWSDLVNDTTWNYRSLLSYFKKSENFTKTHPDAQIDVDFHGYEGPLHTTQCTPQQNISKTFLRGVQQLGYNITDYNGKQQLGASIFQVYTNEGKKVDAGTEFITAIENTRKNLIVSDESFVTKLITSRDNDAKKTRVTGVIFTRHNKTYIATNAKEVILSAGVISSPHILMLSGIGSKNDLETIGIPVVEDLPAVGKNFRDHTFSFITFSTNNSDEYVTLEESTRQYLRGKGPLSRPFTFDVVAWLRTQKNKHQHYPDIELFFFNISGMPLVKKLTGWTDETYEALDAKVPNPFVVILAPCHAKSKGYVKLESADPFQYPLIDINQLSEDEDMEILYEGVRLLLKLAETDALRSINVRLAIEKFPGCEHTKALTKDFWYCYLRRVTGIGHHQVGTCSMGTSPKTAVVDNKFNVFGIEDLRVADASVVPFTLSAHTNAVCTMVGEKISDVIKDKYNRLN